MFQIGCLLGLNTKAFKGEYNPKNMSYLKAINLFTDHKKKKKTTQRILKSAKKYLQSSLFYLIYANEPPTLFSNGQF